MSNDPGGRTAGDIARLSEREALQRLELLGAISSIVVEPTLDHRAAMASVANTCVPTFADLCAIEILDQYGNQEVAAYKVTPTSGLRGPATWEPLGRSGTPDRRPTLGFDRPDEPGHIKAVRERLGATSVIVVPISAGGLTLGWVVFATGPYRRGYRVSALRIAVDIATRLASVIQQAKLLVETQQYNLDQRRSLARLHCLARAALKLAGADSSLAVLQAGCMEAAVMLEGSGAAAMWRLPDGREVRFATGQIDAGSVEQALRSVILDRPARGPGWIAWPLPVTDPWQHAVLAVFLDHDLTDDESLLLSSLASLIPVAFERAVGTETAVRHESRLRAVLEASPIALLAIKPNGTVWSANQAAQRLFAWDPDGLLVLPDAVRPAMFQLSSDVRRTRGIAHRALATEHYDLALSGAPFSNVDDEEAEQSVIVAAVDLSDRRRAEQALIQAQRLEAMGQIAGRVAHDFNNLLTMIGGYVALLKRSVDGDQEQDMLARIDDAATRAGALTKQMLGFTRRQVSTSSVVDIADCVRSIEEVVGRLAGDAIEVDFDVAAVPVPVRVEVHEIEQIILNLAINSLDAIDGTGRLSIGLDVIDAADSDVSSLGIPPGRYTRLRVTDSGHGMDDDVLNRCAEPFFTTKERGRGSGLGLSTVYGVTVEHGGMVSVESEPGAGTCVTVWLPCAGEETAGTAGDGMPAGRLEGRILLVEDENDLRILATQWLTEAGLEVAAFDRAEAALAAEHVWAHVDVVATDIVLPGMSGIELATRLRTARPDLPILYMTGFAARATGGELAPGARLLRKPYRPEELHSMVAALLEESQQGAPDPAPELAASGRGATARK